MQGVFNVTNQIKVNGRFIYAVDTVAIPLTNGQDEVIGSAGDDKLWIDPSKVTASDVFQLGGGVNGLVFASAGTLDLTLPGEMSGLNYVIGSDGSDRFRIDRYSTAAIDGGAGTDTIELVGGGSLNLADPKYERLEKAEGSDGQDDSFIVVAGNSLLIDGKGGTADRVALAGSGALDLRNLTGIEFVDGTNGNDVFTLAAGSAVILDAGEGAADKVVLATAGALDLRNLTHVETVEGSGENDLFTVRAGSSMAVDGKEGDNTVRLSGGGILDLAVSGRYANIQTFEGTDAADDTFRLTAETRVRIEAGLGGTDTLQLSGGGTLDLRGDAFSGIERAEGAVGVKDGFLVDAASTIRVDGKAGEGDTVILYGGGTHDLTARGRFADIEGFSGDQSADVFLITAGQTVYVNGGSGRDTLQLAAAGTLDLTVSGRYLGIETYKGSSGNDTVLIGANQPAVIDAGAGTDTLRLASAGTLDIARLGYADTIERFEGTAGNDRFLVADSSHHRIDGGLGSDTVVLLAPGFLNTDLYIRIETLIATEEDDDITIAAGSTLAVDGGGGKDIVRLASAGLFDLAAPGRYKGVESFIGSSGNDIFRLAPGSRPSVDGGKGTDTVRLSAAGTLDLGLMTGLKNIEAVEGSAGNDRLAGSRAADRLDGGSGNDALLGGGGDDQLKGGAGNDTMTGGDGNDRLSGGEGRDTLTGGAGKDSFVFDSRPGAPHADLIVDYNVVQDTIELDNAVFTRLGKNGVLASGFLAVNATGKAVDRDDYLIYNKQTGALSYDADASGKGAAVEIAHLDKALALTFRDILVI